MWIDGPFNDVVVCVCVYLVFDRACSVVQVIPPRQQVENGAVPQKSDVMPLFGLSGDRWVRDEPG